MKRAIVVLALLATSVACGRSVSRGVQASPPPQAVAAGDVPLAAAPAPIAAPAGSGASTPASPVASASPVAPAAPAAPGTGTAAAGYEIGPPRTFENLTVFPVLSKKQEDVGPLTTLDAALAKGVASVHETGSGPEGAGAQVNSLVIENRGAVPIYVLAGTIVKGGKQDRQIGQDFIVGAKQTVPVDAFCVEHGRWTTTREGVATGGQFGVVGLLTDSQVRGAAEYGKDQGQVWAKVEQVNAANRKQAASGTLLASVDSADIVARRASLSARVDGFLAGTQPGDDVVGLAYAVDGKVRSVRWFSHHKVFELFRPTLVGTAAMEAITAQSQAAAAGRPPTPPPPVAAPAVAQFVDDVQKSAVKEERATPGLNVNDIRDSKAGYSSSTMYKAPAAAPSAAPKPVSTSVTSF